MSAREPSLLASVPARDRSPRLAAAVTVVTTCDRAGKPYGLTVSAVARVSYEPALYLVCIGETSETLPILLDAGVFAINVLGCNQEGLARRFAAKCGTGKFDDVSYRRGAFGGVPLLAGAAGVLQCAVVAAHRGGDHRIVIGAMKAGAGDAAEPLLYYAGRYRRLVPWTGRLAGLPSEDVPDRTGALVS